MPNAGVTKKPTTVSSREKGKQEKSLARTLTSACGSIPWPVIGVTQKSSGAHLPRRVQRLRGKTKRPALLRTRNRNSYPRANRN